MSRIARKYPRYGVPWGKCQTCGGDFPRHQLRLHKRFGWQCLYDWDGGPQRDEIPLYVARPGEGVRKTSAPLTHTLTEGVDNPLVYQLRDRLTGAIWRFDFRSDGFSIDIASDGRADSAWLLNDPWRMYIDNGTLLYGVIPIPYEVPLPPNINLYFDNEKRLWYEPTNPYYDSALTTN